MMLYESHHIKSAIFPAFTTVHYEQPYDHVFSQFNPMYEINLENKNENGSIPVYSHLKVTMYVDQQDTPLETITSCDDLASVLNNLKDKITDSNIPQIITYQHIEHYEFDRSIVIGEIFSWKIHPEDPNTIIFKINIGTKILTIPYYYPSLLDTRFMNDLIKRSSNNLIRVVVAPNNTHLPCIEPTHEQIPLLEGGGRLCSLKDLGINKYNKDLLFIREEVSAGTPAREYLKKSHHGCFLLHDPSFLKQAPTSSLPHATNLPEHHDTLKAIRKFIKHFQRIKSFEPNDISTLIEYSQTTVSSGVKDISRMLYPRSELESFSKVIESTKFSPQALWTVPPMNLNTTLSHMQQFQALVSHDNNIVYARMQYITATPNTIRLEPVCRILSQHTFDSGQKTQLTIRYAICPYGIKDRNTLYLQTENKSYQFTPTSLDKDLATGFVTEPINDLLNNEVVLSTQEENKRQLNAPQTEDGRFCIINPKGNGPYHKISDTIDDENTLISSFEQQGKSFYILEHDPETSTCFPSHMAYTNKNQCYFFNKEGDIPENNPEIHASSLKPHIHQEALRWPIKNLVDGNIDGTNNDHIGIMSKEFRDEYGNALAKVCGLSDACILPTITCAHLKVEQQDSKYSIKFHDAYSLSAGPLEAVDTTTNAVFPLESQLHKSAANDPTADLIKEHIPFHSQPIKSFLGLIFAFLTASIGIAGSILLPREYLIAIVSTSTVLCIGVLYSCNWIHYAFQPIKSFELSEEANTIQERGNFDNNTNIQTLESRI